MESLCTQDRRERAIHTLGKSYDDLVRGIRGDYRNAPDVVAYPTDEREVADLIGWCADIKGLSGPKAEDKAKGDPGAPCQIALGAGTGAAPAATKPAATATQDVGKALGKLFGR